jgi:hypothetical protein
MPYTKSVWRDWFDRSFLLRLHSNYKDVIASIGPLAELLKRYNGEAMNSNRRSFQRAVYDELLRKHQYDAEHRIRMVHKRWQLNKPQQHLQTKLDVRTSTPALQAELTLRNLRTLASLTTPRIWAAVFSTIWNRWCTARRFQQRHAKHNICTLGCSNTAEDSIEHYCRCPYTKELAARYLRLDPTTQVNLHAFNLCCPSITTQEDLVASAVMIYALYRATNHFRHRPEQPANDVFNALRQWAREGAMNNSQTTRSLINQWKSDFTRTPLAPMSTADAKKTTRKRGPSPRSVDDVRPKNSTRRRVEPPSSQHGGTERSLQQAEQPILLFHRMLDPPLGPAEYHYPTHQATTERRWG